MESRYMKKGEQMNTRNDFGLTAQEAYSHVDWMHSYDAKIGYLWKMLERKSLYTMQTEESVLSALKALYNVKGRQQDDLPQMYEVHLEFANELFKRGYSTLGQAAIREIREDYQKNIEESKPDSRPPNEEHRLTEYKFYGSEMYKKSLGKACANWRRKDSAKNKFLRKVKEIEQEPLEYERRLQLPSFKEIDVKFYENSTLDNLIGRIRDANRYKNRQEKIDMNCPRPGTNSFVPYYIATPLEDKAKPFLKDLKERFDWDRLSTLAKALSEMYYERGWDNEYVRHHFGLNKHTAYSEISEASSLASTLQFWGDDPSNGFKEFIEESAEKLSGEASEHYAEYRQLIRSYNDKLLPEIKNLAGEGKFWTAKQLSRRRVTALAGLLKYWKPAAKKGPGIEVKLDE
jgi:hypothetical protein